MILQQIEVAIQKCTSKRDNDSSASVLRRIRKIRRGK
jgi:hypothetical protein